MDKALETCSFEGCDNMCYSCYHHDPNEGALYINAVQRGRVMDGQRLRIWNSHSGMHPSCENGDLHIIHMDHQRRPFLTDFFETLDLGRPWTRWTRYGCWSWIWLWHAMAGCIPTPGQRRWTWYTGRLGSWPGGTPARSRCCTVLHNIVGSYTDMNQCVQKHTKLGYPKIKMLIIMFTSKVAILGCIIHGVSNPKWTKWTLRRCKLATSNNPNDITCFPLVKYAFRGPQYNYLSCEAGWVTSYPCRSVLMYYRVHWCPLSAHFQHHLPCNYFLETSINYTKSWSSTRQKEHS